MRHRAARVLNWVAAEIKGTLYIMIAVSLIFVAVTLATL